jgi:hypothetical protein
MEKNAPVTNSGEVAAPQVEGEHSAKEPSRHDEISNYGTHGRRRRRRRSEKRSIRSYLTPSTKAWTVLGLVLVTLLSTAGWSYYLMEENESLRRKAVSDAFNNKERISNLENLLNAPRMRNVVSVDLKPHAPSSAETQQLVQIRRPENGAVLLNLAVSQRSDRWDIEMRDLTGTLRARLTTKTAEHDRIQVMLTDLELNTYTILARLRGTEQVFLYSFSLN